MSTESPATARPSQAAGRHATIWIGITLGCAALVIIGSFLPWAHVADYAVNGFDNDGRITFVIALLAVFFGLWGAGWIGIGGKPAVPLSMLIACMALIMIIGLADAGDVQNLTDTGFGTYLDIGIDGGLVLVVLFGILGTATSIVGLIMRIKKK